MVTDGLFVATPPLEALRLLLSWAATVEGKGAGSFAGARIHGKRKGIPIADVSRAFFSGPVEKLIYVQLPGEDKEEGKDEVAELAF